MKDKLHKMFEIQNEFINKLFDEQYKQNICELNDKDKVKWSKEYILSATKELYESLDELPSWKAHRLKLNNNNNNNNLIEELVDTFKFLLNILIINKIDIDTFFSKFIDKSNIVRFRYEQEKLLQEVKNSNDSFIVFDIDGVLNNYPKNFIDYFNSLGYNYKTIERFKEHDLIEYEKVKHQFRETGEELNCIPLKENIEILNILKENGYKIILITARPYNKYSRLFNDTIVWLENNNVKYDYLFFSKQKEYLLLENFNKEQIKLVVDDQINNIKTLNKYFNSFLFINKYQNYDLKHLEGIKTITNLNELL